VLPLELIRKDPDRVRRAAELKGEPEGDLGFADSGGADDDRDSGQRFSR